MTLKTLKEFGININRKSKYEFEIPGQRKYKACKYVCERDYSQFAFYAVLGAINNDITCGEGLNKDSLQGDKEILNILSNFNVKYKFENNHITIFKSNNIQGN